MTIAIFFRYDIMIKCWKQEPDERPPFDELVPKLYRMTEDENVS